MYADDPRTLGFADSFGKLPPPWEGWSEWQDLNLRPPRPERGALPGCATLRLEGRSYSGALIPSQARAVFRYRAMAAPRLRPADGETDGARNTAIGEICSRAPL